MNAVQGSSAVVWFRRDLRVDDHPALADAVARADRIVPLFVLDPRLLGDATAPPRAWYLRRSLAMLDAQLRERGSGLVVREGDPAVEVVELARAVGADEVLATRDVTPFAHRRDRSIARALELDGRRLLLRPGLLLAEPEQIHTKAGTPFSVFTPFWRALQAAPRRLLTPAPQRVPTPPELLGASGERMRQLREAAPPFGGLQEPGARAAARRLRAWVDRGLTDYGEGRDVLSGVSTSHLGADLHLGTLSPLQVETAASAAAEAATPFVRQLAWREFYHHQLFHRRSSDRHPRDPMMAAFRDEADDPAAVADWRAGQTGIPTVDAAMRQLATTGWMSNRARLIVASFLTRHLLMDYRIGERHFMRHLVDGDVANNLGGWQWAAGVGADPQPWFRIFNPVRQGRRFDEDGAWVRSWVPELADVPDRYVHAPWESPQPIADYPGPIVDLAEARERALAAFRSIDR